MRRRLSPAAIGHWSARRPWLAIALWLGFVVVCVAGLAVTGSKQLQSGATGESARAENMMKAHQARPPGVQLEYAYLHSDALRASDPVFRTAFAKVRTSMTQALVGGPPGSEVTTTISAGGHSALVAAPVNRNFSTGALAAVISSDGSPQVSAVL